MNAHAAEFRRCLAELDVAGIRSLWLLLYPHLPQPGSDKEALATLHMARTQAASITIEQRAYSHRWLLDHGFPSRLPDELKPRAERMFPKIVNAVGVSVNFSAKELKPAGVLIEKAMADTVSDAYANGDTDPGLVRRLMFEAGAKERRKLFDRG